LIGLRKEDMSIEIRADSLGFPMTRIPEVDVFVHALPVTKIQFEAFLCDALDSHFDQKWYDKVLELNPRVSPRRIWTGNYWHAFLTGILPAEAQRFARWMGYGYRLPNPREWRAVFRAAAAVPQGLGGLVSPGWGASARSSEMLTRLDSSIRSAAVGLGYPQDLATAMAMRLGVAEWVSLDGSNGVSWATLGEPHPAFCGNLWSPEQTALMHLPEPESLRSPIAGFRLIFDPVLAAAEGN
jgi:hypothetical protein